MGRDPGTWIFAPGGWLMVVSNAEVAAGVLRDRGPAGIRGENPFRVRAYRTAARTVGDLPRGRRADDRRQGGPHVAAGIARPRREDPPAVEHGTLDTLGSCAARFESTLTF